MPQTATGILNSPTGPYIIPSSPNTRPSRLLGMVVVTRSQDKDTIDFINRLFKVLRGIAQRNIAVIIVTHNNDYAAVYDNLKHLLQRYSALYLMREGSTTNIAEAIFRAWQRNKATLVGSLESGDYGGMEAIPAMLAEARRNRADVVVGYRRVWSRKAALIPAIGHAMSLQLCGRTIMPDLFATTAHPFSTCMLLRRENIEGQQMRLHGDIMLPNLIAQVPSLRVTETPYPDSANNEPPRVQLLNLIPALFRLNVLQKTHVLESS